MYAKRDGVAAYHIVWIGLCLRSVPGVRILASAVDVVHSRESGMYGGEETGVEIFGGKTWRKKITRRI